MADPAISSRDKLQAAELLSAIYVQEDRLAEATRLLDQLVQHRPHPQYWFLLGVCRQRQADIAGAIQALDKALALSPGATQAQSLLGWAQMLHEDYDDALATFSKVLMKEPANALARINVGYICLKKHIFGEAIEHLSKAIRLDNDRKATLYAHYYLGLVYLERDMFQDAQGFFRAAIALAPNFVQAYYELGTALAKPASVEPLAATDFARIIPKTVRMTPEAIGSRIRSLPEKRGERRSSQSRGASASLTSFSL